jgi:hypothetical protein
LSKTFGADIFDLSVTAFENRGFHARREDPAHSLNSSIFIPAAATARSNFASALPLPMSNLARALTSSQIRRQIWLALLLSR